MGVGCPRQYPVKHFLIKYGLDEFNDAWHDLPDPSAFAFAITDRLQAKLKGISFNFIDALQVFAVGLFVTYALDYRCLLS
jgi:hypothetical protein